MKTKTKKWHSFVIYITHNDFFRELGVVTCTANRLYYKYM